MLNLIAFVILICLILWLLNKMKIKPDGRYVLITGCDSGFGHLLAKSLDQKGCFVFATCLTSNGAEALREVSSDRLFAFTMDVSDSESIKAAFKTVDKILQQKSAGLWGLVNNAGIAGNMGYYDWWTRDEFRRILEVNLLGPVEVTNVFSPLLRKAKGRVVNVSSSIVFTPLPSGGYEMAKSALEAYSDCLRVQMRNSSVSVSLIEPGFFDTKINDTTRVSEKSEMVWDRFSEEQKQFYGKECVDGTRDLFLNSAKTYSDSRLYLVTDAIEYSLFAWFPWKRYPIGSMTRFVVRPMSFCPAFLVHLFSQLVYPLPKPRSVCIQD